MNRHVRPPSGEGPPERTTLGEQKLDLRELAEEICRRYRREYPDEEERYGDAGMAWCIHDNQHILNWAVLDLRGFTSLESELEWLAGVLTARNFPRERLLRNLELAADVVGERAPAAGTAIAQLLRVSCERLARVP
ncbi:MAG: hypothetical protein NVSMB25_25600 [Thermoleophilaceae bacterium]